jgi:hypothetical protein
LLSARLRSETSDDVGEASGKYVRKNGIEFAYPGTKIAYPGNADIASLDDLLQLAEIIFSEVFRAFSGDGYVATVLVVVPIGEAIKFDLVRVRIQARGLCELVRLNWRK